MLNKFLEILKENPIKNYYSISRMEKLIPVGDKLAWYDENGNETLLEKDDSDVVFLMFNEKLYERFLKIHANIMSSRGLKQNIDADDPVVRSYARKHFGNKPSAIQMESIITQAQREMNPHIMIAMAQVMTYIAMGASLFISKDETKYELHEPFFAKSKSGLSISKRYIEHMQGLVKKEEASEDEEYLDIFDSDELETVYQPVFRTTNKQELNIAIVEGFIEQHSEFGEFIRKTEIARFITMAIAIMNHENRGADDTLDITEDSFRKLTADVFGNDEGDNS